MQSFSLIIRCSLTWLQLKGWICNTNSLYYRTLKLSSWKGSSIPSISMFFGIIIFMYLDDHNPPHFHAVYQDFEAQFDMGGNLIAGTMPHKEVRLISAWAELHRDELFANWELTQNEQLPYIISPLR